MGKNLKRNNIGITDLELVQLVAQHDMGAFNELYKRYIGKARNLIYQIIRDTSQVDDVAQNVMIRLWEKASTFKGEAAFASWFYRIAYNEALQHLRCLKIKNRPIVSENQDLIISTAPEPVYNASYQQIKLEAHALMYACVYMPNKYWEPFYLLAIGYTIREVAQKYNLSISAVKSRVHRARNWFDKQYKRAKNPKFCIGTKARLDYMTKWNNERAKGSIK